MNNRSKILMIILPVLACFAFLPATQAVSPAPDGCYGNFTTAEGCNALLGLGNGLGNTGVGWYSLSEAGDSNFSTGAGAGALALNTADSNTAVGAAALLLNSTGTQSVAVGTDALVYNNADANSAVGFEALEFNASSVTNTALGVFAAQNNDSSGSGTADFNTAVGGYALRANVDGTRNTAVGAGALESFTGGNDNTAVGELAGNNYNSGTETNNICIGSGTQGTTGESNAIRIGDASTSGGIDVINNGPAANAILIGTGNGSQGISVTTLIGFGTVQIGRGLNTVAGASSCYIGGIVSNPVPQAPGNPVVTIDPVTQQLGMTTDFSAAKVEEQQKQIEEQQASITQLKIEMQTMVAQLKEQAAQIQKVSAQLEMQRPATKVVVNEP